jgi:uncharacterized membrane protein HdeD (DUF308 family)
MFSFSNQNRMPRGFDWGLLVAGVLSAVVGIYVLRYPGKGLRFLVIAFALLSIMQGIVWLSAYSRFHNFFGPSWSTLISAIVDIVIGILFLFYQQVGALSLAIMVGIWFVADAIVGIVFSWHLRDFSTGSFVFNLVLNILCLILAVMILLNPVVTAFSLSYLLAFTLIIFGINEIVLAFARR